jgi:hypothetical protein
LDEDHQKSDDRGSGIDHKLPSIAESEQWTRTAHAATTETAIMNVNGLPVILAVNFAKRENQDFDLVGLMGHSQTFNPHNPYHMLLRLGDNLPERELTVPTGLMKLIQPGHFRLAGVRE